MTSEQKQKQKVYPCKGCKWDRYSKQDDEVYIDKHCGHCHEPSMRGYTPLSKKTMAKTITTVIQNCWQCDFRGSTYDNNMMRCDKLNKTVKGFTIDPDCPLPDSPLTEEQIGIQPLTEEQISTWLSHYYRKIGDDNAQMFIDFQRYLFGVPKESPAEKQAEEIEDMCASCEYKGTFSDLCDTCDDSNNNFHPK